MERINRILEHAAFRENIDRNEAAEQGRQFCRHDLGHLFDVARIGTILVLEEGLNIPRELIYAAALLHDIGKNLQYTQGVPHEMASARIAPQILRDCGFDKKETDVITEAILGHRDSKSAAEGGLKGILYRADKASRPCFACKAKAACRWKEDKKNLRATY